MVVFDDETIAALTASVSDIQLDPEGQKLAEQGKMIFKQLQTLKATGMTADEINDIVMRVQDGMCNVISDYQRIQVDLMAMIVHKTNEVDRIEKKMNAASLERDLIAAENTRLIAYNDRLVADSRLYDAIDTLDAITKRARH
jgi:hypothetical protein